MTIDFRSVARGMGPWLVCDWDARNVTDTHPRLRHVDTFRNWSAGGGTTYRSIVHAPTIESRMALLESAGLWGDEDPDEYHQSWADRSHPTKADAFSEADDASLMEFIRGG